MTTMSNELKETLFQCSVRLDEAKYCLLMTQQNLRAISEVLQMLTSEQNDKRYTTYANPEE